MNYVAYFTAKPHSTIPVFIPHTDEWVEHKVDGSGTVIFYVGKTIQQLSDRYKLHKYHFYQTYEWLNGGLEHLHPSRLTPSNLFFAVQCPWNFQLMPLEGDVEAEQIQWHWAEGHPLVNTQFTGLKRGIYKSVYSPVVAKYHQIAEENWEKRGYPIFERDTTQRAKLRAGI